MDVVRWWQRWRADAPKRQLRRTIAGAKRASAWLKKRPLSDKYDGTGRHKDSTGRGRW